MKERTRLLWLATGMILGVAGAILWLSPSSQLHAANDRHEDFILCTGPVAVSARAPTDGVWLLDYRTGRLLGTVIDRSIGKIVGWGELDLVAEFGIAPRHNAHFLMTTGNISLGQAALYVAETSTGKMGVYTMGPRPDGLPGAAIVRHDMTSFRQSSAKEQLPSPKDNH